MTDSTDKAGLTGVRGDAPSRVQAVVFDMDGLMLDTERVSLRAWNQAAAEMGWDMPIEVVHGIIGMNQAGSRAYLLKHLGEDFPLADYATQTHRHYTRILDEEGIRLMAGLSDLLAWLRSIGMPLAVATSTRHHLALDKLGKAGILDHFAHVIGGDQIAHGKPAPDIYLEAAGRLGKPPQACIALEDSINGVRAAHGAGMPVILVPDLVNPPQEIHDLACATLVTLADARAVIEPRL